MSAANNDMANLRSHMRNSVFGVGKLANGIWKEGLGYVGDHWSGRQGAINFGNDMMALGSVAAAGVIATRALGSINVASDDALNSAASAAGNLLGYRMTMNAMNMIPGLGV